MAGLGGPYGLDFGSVLAMGSARKVDLTMLSEVLPACEAAIVTGRDGYSEEDDDGAQ